MNPKPLYEIDLKYDKYNIGQFVKKMRIYNEMNKPYSSFIIILGMDYNYIQEINMFTQQKLIMTIRSYDLEGNSLETIKIDLAILYSDLKLISQKIDMGLSDIDHRDMQDIKLECASIHALNKMSSTVSYITDTKTTAIDAIKNMLDIHKYDSSGISTAGSNEVEFRQLCVPQMSIQSMFEYMNSICGVYDGPYYYYCDYKGNIKSGNLKYIYDSDTKIHIHQVMPDNDNNSTNTNKIAKLILDSNDNDAHYITTSEINVVNQSNDIILQNGYYNIYMTHPSNDLFEVSTYKLDDVLKEHGLTESKSYESQFHTDFKYRRSYNISKAGDNVDKKYLSTKIVAPYLAMTPIEVKIGGSLRLKSLLNICNSISLKTYAPSYKKYKGNYLLASSIIDIDFTTNASASAKLIMLRSFTGNSELIKKTKPIKAETKPLDIKQKNVVPKLPIVTPNIEKEPSDTKQTVVNNKLELDRELSIDYTEYLMNASLGKGDFYRDNVQTSLGVVGMGDISYLRGHTYSSIDEGIFSDDTYTYDTFDEWLDKNPLQKRKYQEYANK